MRLVVFDFDRTLAVDEIYEDHLADPVPLCWGEAGELVRREQV